MKQIIDFFKFVTCIFLCLTVLFIFSMIGTLVLIFGYQYITSRWFILIEILIGAPLLLLILAPVLEAAKRINFLNPYNQSGRQIISICVMLLCAYLLYSSLTAEGELPPLIKLSYLIYTLTIYIAFAIYTYKWHRTKISTDWFDFEDQSKYL